MIGLGDLLLVVSHAFAVPSFSFIGGVGKKVNGLNFAVRNIFAGSHIEHHWK